MEPDLGMVSGWGPYPGRTFREGCKMEWEEVKTPGRDLSVVSASWAAPSIAIHSWTADFHSYSQSQAEGCTQGSREETSPPRGWGRGTGVKARVTNTATTVQSGCHRAGRGHLGDASRMREVRAQRCSLKLTSEPEIRACGFWINTKQKKEKIQNLLKTDRNSKA